MYLETTISGHFVWSIEEGVLVKESKGELCFLYVNSTLNKYQNKGVHINESVSYASFM